MTNEDLIAALDDKFGHVHDNNRDIILDPIFSLAEVREEIDLAAAVDYVVAYLTRNSS